MSRVLNSLTTGRRLVSYYDVLRRLPGSADCHLFDLTSSTRLLWKVTFRHRAGSERTATVAINVALSTAIILLASSCFLAPYIFGWHWRGGAAGGLFGLSPFLGIQPKKVRFRDLVVRSQPTSLLPDHTDLWRHIIAVDPRKGMTRGKHPLATSFNSERHIPTATIVIALGNSLRWRALQAAITGRKLRIPGPG